MELFSYKFDAANSFEGENKIFLNRKCPFSPNDCLCGNWCALFQDFTDKSGDTFVIMGCRSNHDNVERLPSFKKE